jgi:glutathione S-transferase
MAIKLYSWPMSSGTRVAWALEELSVPYELITLDGQKGEHRTPQYLAINPQGKVPALVDDDLNFFDSGAILLYLGDKYGIEKKLWPAGSGQARADAICWTISAMNDLGNNLMQYIYHGLDSPVSYGPADRSKACAEYNRSQYVRWVDGLQTRLQQREYVLDTFTLADVAIASWLFTGKMLGVTFDSHPRVADWLQRCGERPAFKRAR